jgi:hypothetical protein
MKQETVKSEYDIQAEKFLKNTKTEFSFKFVKYDKYFLDEGEERRDIYEITLKRENRSWKFTFGQSTAASGEYILFNANRDRIHLILNKDGKKILNIKSYGMLNNGNSMKNKEFKEPSAYDVLAGITKNEPGTFEDFCGDYGYEVDSIKASKVYEAVKNEWANVQRMFSDKEIEALQEIQ